MDKTRILADYKELLKQLKENRNGEIEQLKQKLDAEIAYFEQRIIELTKGI